MNVGECRNCYYKLLDYGIKCNRKECNMNDIKEKRKKIVLNLHPDKGGNEEEYKEFSSCYDWIVENRCLEHQVFDGEKSNWM